MFRKIYHMPRKRTPGNRRNTVPFLVIVLDLQLFADIEIIVESIIVFIDDAHATISRFPRRKYPSIVMINFGSFIVLSLLYALQK